MAYKITDDCIACGSCADECPNDAIISGDEKYEIKADECLDCGACADACPNDAIVAE
ncbi:4Fe-4S binding protein [Terrisporobacter mayombei]|nr:4Fe-4S binding protein [Terrisporobacter mayombei]